MTPTNVLLDRIADQIRTDVLALAPAVLPCRVHLSKSPFTPSAILTPASFTEADFGGYVVLVQVVGPQQSFLDPASGTRIIQLVEPAGGWHWQTTTLVLLPQTIHGFFVTDTSNLILWGSQLFPAPILLTSVGHNVDIGQIRVSIPPGVIF